MKEYFVVRLCNKQDGTVAAPVQGFDTKEEAYKDYYRKLGQAVDSDHLTDAVALLTKEGFQIEYKCFEHEPQPQEEPTEE